MKSKRERAPCSNLKQNLIRVGLTHLFNLSIHVKRVLNLVVATTTYSSGSWLRVLIFDKDVLGR